MIRGLNCREPRRINFSKAYLEIENGITKIAAQNLLEAAEEVTPWKESVLFTVKGKTKKIKKNIQHKQIKPLLCDPDVNYA